MFHIVFITLALLITVPSYNVFAQEALLNGAQSLLSNAVNDILNPNGGVMEMANGVITQIYAPKDGVMGFEWAGLSPMLLDAALDDLDNIQTVLKNNTGFLKSVMFPPHGTQGFQLLQAFGPAVTSDYTGCEQQSVTDDLPPTPTGPQEDTSILPTYPVISANDESGGQANNDEENVTIQRQKTKSNSDTSMRPQALADEIILAAPSEAPSDFSQQEDELLPTQVPSSQMPSAASCEELIRYNMLNGFVESLMSKLQTTPDIIFGAIDDATRQSTDTVQKILSQRVQIFDDFVGKAVDTVRARMRANTNTLGQVVSNFQDNLQAASDLGRAGANTALAKQSATGMSLLNTPQIGLQYLSNIQPALYTWIETPMELLEGSTSALRGFFKPLSSPTQILQTALAPLGLSQDLQELCEVDPRLTGLFEYFNHPQAAPTFVTLKTLLDEITRTGTLQGLDRFQTLLEPYQALAQPLGLRLGLANAVLDYLHSVYPGSLSRL